MTTRAVGLVGLILIDAASAGAAVVAHLPNTGVNAVKVDASGLYVAGFVGTLGTPDTYDAFVSKLSLDGSKVIYMTKFAGSKSDFISALDIDSTGAAYLLGQTVSPDFPVTTGALQTQLLASTGQGFVAKVDPQGKVVYATLIGGSAKVDPSGGAVLADSAGEVYVSGQTVGDGFPSTSGAPVTSTDFTAQFVAKLDATGSKLLASVRGLGGRLAFDGQGNVYLAGATSTSIPVTPGAFQMSFNLRGCGGTGQLGVACSYQYIAKLNPALSQIVYATFLTGTYGAVPAAISVDAQGDATVAGTTNSSDYPATGNAFQPFYIANAPPGPQINLFGTIYPPPASGYATTLNPTGTGLIYSTFFSGTQADTITFAAFTGAGIVMAGQAGSPDLPGLDGVPLQCLPETFATRLSLNGTAVTAARIVPGNVLAFEPAAGTILAWTGTDLIRFDPSAPPPAVACVLDAADLKPVTSIAPGELLSIFGPHFAGSGTSAAPATFPRSLFGVGVAFNGVSAPLLYLSPQQINVQVPFEIAGSAQASLALTLPQVSGVADSRTLPVVGMNPTVFLDTVTPLNSLSFVQCGLSGGVYSGGPLPVAFNSDGSRNSCSNPAGKGSAVRVFLQGLGVTGQAVTGGINASPGEPLTVPVSANIVGGPGASVVGGAALAGSISGVWAVDLTFASNNTGAVPVSLSVGVPGGSAPVRDMNLTILIK
ncbi:MAG TPA: hypothetical protein VKT49_20655 [Bryobacteraceae bacterium]|nr:hypothetical protein [Bryobacteraceae bacterium]